MAKANPKKQPEEQAGPAPTNLRELWQRYRKKGDVESRNALTEHYFDMVRANAENIATIIVEAVEENDLYQAGVVSFFEAMNKYDPAQHGTFEEFGSNAIRRGIAEELRALIGVDETAATQEEE